MQFFLKDGMNTIMMMVFVADNEVWKSRRNIHRDRIHLHREHHHTSHCLWQLHHDNKGDDDDEDNDDEDDNKTVDDNGNNGDGDENPVGTL